MKTEQAAAGTPLIELRDIYKIYHMGDTEVHASDGVSLKICKGEFVAIVGQSGSGKSTLMNIIGCLDVPTSGQYFLDGEDVSELTDDEQAEIRNKTLGFIFQQYNLIPKLNVQENVELSLLYAGVPAEERAERARYQIARVGLAGKEKTCPASCPAASSSACRLHGRLRETLRSSWPTSRPARSTRAPAARCWISCASSTTRAIPSS